MIHHAVLTTGAVAALTLAVFSSACVQAQDKQAPAQALADIRARAEAGEAPAQFTLGFVYGAGRGVTQEDIEAVILYRKAATAKLGGVGYTDEEVASILGIRPRFAPIPQPLPPPPNQPQFACSGRTTMRDVLVDSDLIQQAVMYALGEGVPQDDAEAFAWYFKAAEQCSAVAQFNLGVMYTSGEGVVLPDDAAAVTWFREAAEQGDAPAQFTLGFMYANDGLRPPNDVEAHMWLNLAATRSTGAGRTRSVTERDKVAERMTPADLSEAQRRASEWHAAHQVP